VLSTAGEEIDKVLLLQMGVDDYVVTPFGACELPARIRAVLRRAPNENKKIVSFSDTKVDIERRVVTRNGKEVQFTPVEYNLILNSVWGSESYPNTWTVDAQCGSSATQAGSGP
jgi:DNA-binding response OmpR family regulator